MAKNVLIATLGESPIVVTSMVHALQTQKNLTIDELHVIHPKEEIIDEGYKLVKEHLEGKCGVTRSILHFPDVSSYEKSIEFLRVLSNSIQTYEGTEDHVYLSLAGGRKNMSALMAATCQFFKCVRGLYHILDKYENDSDKQNFYSIEALWLKFEPSERSEKLNPPSDELILVEIPYQQLPQGDALWQYFSEIASNPDAQPPIEINDELEDWGRKIHPQEKDDQQEENAVLDVYLSKKAYDEFTKEITDSDVRARFMHCFRSMKNLKYRSKQLKAAKTDCRPFKMGRTAERPFYYRTKSEVIICHLSQKNTTYDAICKGNMEIWKKDHGKYIRVSDLQQVSKLQSDSILIAPLGKTPMVVTQTFALLSTIEGADIKKVIVLHPKNSEIRNGVNLLKTAFQKKGFKRTIESKEINNITDVASTDDCNVYLEKLTSVIIETQEENPDKSIHLSLSGGRKGMAALTLFAAQQAKIDAVYHTLITDADLEEEIEKETTLSQLKNLTRTQQVQRLFLDDYDRSKFELVRVPVIPIS